MSLTSFFDGKGSGVEEISTERVDRELFDGDFGVDWGTGEDDGDRFRFPFAAL